MFNVTFGAAWSVLVLYATERLGLGAVGFGLITTVSAVGGLLGTLSYGWITARISLGDLMRIGLIIETLTHLVLALTTNPYVAMPVFFVFGAHAFIWGTTAITIRQRAVPMELQGRVGSVNLIGVFGGLVVGAGDRRCAGPALRRHRAVLVRLRRLGRSSSASSGASCATSPTTRTHRSPTSGRATPPGPSSAAGTPRGSSPRRARC